MGTKTQNYHPGEKKEEKDSKNPWYRTIITRTATSRAKEHALVEKGVGKPERKAYVTKRDPTSSARANLAAREALSRQ